MKSKSSSIPHEVIRLMVQKEVSRVRAWREYLGLTQEEVATKMAISQAALSQIEAIDSKPRKATLQKLSTTLTVAVEDLR